MHLFIYFLHKSAVILKSLDSSFCVKVVISCGSVFCLLLFLQGSYGSSLNPLSVVETEVLITYTLLVLVRLFYHVSNRCDRDLAELEEMLPTLV